MSEPRFSYGKRHYTSTVADAPALEARNLHVAHAGGAKAALVDLNLKVPVGTRVALVGPNGAGKSTLLKAAAGLLPVVSGALLIYGQPVGACHHRVAYLPQRGEIDWNFPISVRRLVLSGRYVHVGWLRRPDRQDLALADQAIERMGLTALADRQIGQLSGGQQQRALLARALAQDAELLLLDEPLNAVDAETRTVVGELLVEIGRSGKTAVVATHDLGRLDTDFDGALYLSEGRETPPPPGAFAGQNVGTHAS